MQGLGLVHAYYGRGTGVTSTAMGRAVRAAGAGLRVAIGQFMKNGKSSEVKVLKQIPRINYYSPGEHEFIVLGNKPSPQQIYHTQKTFEYVKEKSQDNIDLLICDEILNAILFEQDIISLNDLILFIENKKPDLELILTGLYCPIEIKERAHYCTEHNEVKHPRKDLGIDARLGIEY